MASLLPGWLRLLLLLYSGRFATTYGYGELRCGSQTFPLPCQTGATTATGLPFQPDEPIMALAIAVGQVLPRGCLVRVSLLGSQPRKCVPLKLEDKKAARYLGSQQPFDLTPGALRALGVKPNPNWQGRIEICF